MAGRRNSFEEVDRYFPLNLLCAPHIARTLRTCLWVEVVLGAGEAIQAPVVPLHGHLGHSCLGCERAHPGKAVSGTRAISRYREHHHGFRASRLSPIPPTYSYWWGERCAQHAPNVVRVRNTDPNSVNSHDIYAAHAVRVRIKRYREPSPQNACNTRGTPAHLVCIKEAAQFSLAWCLTISRRSDSFRASARPEQPRATRDCTTTAAASRRRRARWFAPLPSVSSSEQAFGDDRVVFAVA